MAAWRYPGGFDWFYTVASALASQKHNPAGSAWFAGALSLAMVLLWRYASGLKLALGPLLHGAPQAAFTALRLGILSSGLLGLERWLIRDLSSWMYKAHELLAVLAFLGLYVGVSGLLMAMMWRNRTYVLPALLVLSPLLAIAVSQVWLYLEQRDLGWVDTHWRALGIPVWLSFAFWQWLALLFLWLGLGSLACAGRARNPLPGAKAGHT